MVMVISSSLLLPFEEILKLIQRIFNLAHKNSLDMGFPGLILKG